jgi:hypothetical protein
MWSPLILARTQNYAFDDDSWGRWTYRKAKSPWSADVWSKYSGSVNEHMISDALSLLDDLELVEAYNSTQRDELISWLKGHGITHIRYMPVEDRIVTSIDSTSKAKVKANWAEHPELLDPLREPGEHAGAAPATVPSPPAAPKTEQPPVNAKEFLDNLLSNVGKDPFVQEIKDTFSTATIYQATPDIYYAKVGGLWYSFDVHNGVLGGANLETGTDFVKGLESGVKDGSLAQVHAPAGDAPKVSPTSKKPAVPR